MALLYTFMMPFTGVVSWVVDMGSKSGPVRKKGSKIWADGVQLKNREVHT